MATIQSAINHALQSAANIRYFQKTAKGLKDISKTINKNNEEPSATQIAETEAREEAANVEARRSSFPDAQAQHDVQEAARAAAENLSKENPNFGFYTTRSNATAFGEPSSSDRFNLGVPEGYQKPPKQYSAEERAAVLSRHKEVMNILRSREFNQQMNTYGGL